MIHHHIETTDGDVGAGHYAVGRNNEFVLAQIGERDGGRQCRLPLRPTQALRLAADLIEIGLRAEVPGTVSYGDMDEGPWFLSGAKGRVTIHFRDERRCADPEAELAMPHADALAFGELALEAANAMMAGRPSGITG